MDLYVTGNMIRKLREEKKMTQSRLAEKLCVSDKAISKWETGKGYPDITLIEPLAAALGISVAELFAGSHICNRNRHFNMLRTCFYVCPLCGNVLISTGDAQISCCGITLQKQEAEEADEAHQLIVENVEDEYFVRLDHEMTREHNISFIAGVSDEGVQLIKLYPEGNAETRLRRARTKYIYWYCNHHGLFRANMIRRKLSR